MNGRRALVLGLGALLCAAALPSVLAESVNSEARVKNKDPLLEDITLTAGDDDPGTAGMQVSPTPGTSRDLSFRLRASDANNWRDIAKVTYELKGPGGQKLAEGTATPEGEGTGRSCTYAFSWTLPYHQTPGLYTVEAKVTDKVGGTGKLEWTFEVLPTLAMVLDQTALNFGGRGGTLEPGTSNLDAPATIVVRNMGNVGLDLGLSGTDLVSTEYDARIPVKKLTYSTNPTMLGAMPLSTSLATDPGFDLAPGAAATKTAYFVLYTPTGDEQYVPASTYKGTLTLSAVVNS
ncbi:MAG TPA: hypothetical protein VNZ52_11230 [Candidatus Thermoplasmatota archaeon]|nr:hypothetical protein [Candidatus Thermoplasmatota archaeon]